MLKYEQKVVEKIFELIMKCQEEQEMDCRDVIGITYTELFKKLNASGNHINSTPFSNYLKQLYKSNWLSRIDCGRGKNVYYKITWIGEIAYYNQICLGSNDIRKNALQMILVLSYFGMYYKRQITQGKELKSVLEYNPNTIYGYFDISTREGFRIKDICEKIGHISRWITSTYSC